MKSIARTMIAFALVLMVVPLIQGCSNSTSSNESDNNQKNEATSTARDTTLTQQVNFYGLTFNVNPSWKKESWPSDTGAGESIKYTISSGALISANVFFNNETRSLNSFYSEGPGALGFENKYAETEQKWDKDGVNYSKYSTTVPAGSDYVLILGHADNGTGFDLFINRGEKGNATYLPDGTVDALIDSLNFNPEVALSRKPNSTTNEATGTSSESAAPAPTVSQQNALRTALSYLDYKGFSYTGLIEQLEYEKYSHEDAVYAADHCGADWNVQAARSAKSYMDYKAFSRGGLIDQLEYEGFTPEQAAYGADSVGL